MTAGAAGHTTRRGGWRAPLLLLLGAGALLGLSTNLAKLGGQWRVPPLALLAWSVAGAALALWGRALVLGRTPPPTRRTVEYFAVAALVTVAASNLIFFSAVPRVGASVVALVIAFPPLLTYLAALALGMERFGWLRAAGVGLALAGAVVLAASELSAPDAAVGWLLPTFCGPVLFAVGNITARCADRPAPRPMRWRRACCWPRRSCSWPPARGPASASRRPSSPARSRWCWRSRRPSRASSCASSRCRRVAGRCS